MFEPGYTILLFLWNKTKDKKPEQEILKYGISIFIHIGIYLDTILKPHFDVINVVTQPLKINSQGCHTLLAVIHKPFGHTNLIFLYSAPSSTG